MDEKESIEKESIEKESTEIKPKKIEIIPQKEISISNQKKWKLIDKNYGLIYSETKRYVNYCNLMEDDGGKIIKIILNFYFENKKIDPKLKKVSESILDLMDVFAMEPQKVNKNEFIIKMNALIDHVKEYEYGFE